MWEMLSAWTTRSVPTLGLLMPRLPSYMVVVELVTGRGGSTSPYKFAVDMNESGLVVLHQFFGQVGHRQDNILCSIAVTC